METVQKQLTYQDYKNVVEQLFSDNKSKLEKEFTLKTFIISNYQSNTDLFKELDKFYKQAISDFDTIRLIKHDSKNDKIVFPTKEEKNSRIALNKLAYEIHDSVLLDCTKQIAWRASFDNGEYWKNLKDYQTYFFGSDNLDLGKELLRYKKADFYYIQYDTGNLHEQNSQIIDFIQKQIDLKIGEKKPLTIKDVIEKLFDKTNSDLENTIFIRDYIINNFGNNSQVFQDLDKYRDSFIEERQTIQSIRNGTSLSLEAIQKSYNVFSTAKREAWKSILEKSTFKDNERYYNSLKEYKIYFSGNKDLNLGEELAKYQNTTGFYTQFGPEHFYKEHSSIVEFIKEQIEIQGQTYNDNNHTNFIQSIIDKQGQHYTDFDTYKKFYENGSFVFPFIIEIDKYECLKVYYNALKNNLITTEINKIIQFLHSEYSRLNKIQSYLPTKEEYLGYFEQINILDKFLGGSIIITSEKGNEELVKHSNASSFWQKLYTFKEKTRLIKPLEVLIRSVEIELDTVTKHYLSLKSDKEPLSQSNLTVYYYYRDFLEVYLEHLKNSLSPKSVSKTFSETNESLIFDSYIIKTYPKKEKLLTYIKKEYFGAKGKDLAFLIFAMYDKGMLIKNPTKSNKSQIFTSLKNLINGDNGSYEAFRIAIRDFAPTLAKSDDSYLSILCDLEKL